MALKHTSTLLLALLQVLRDGCAETTSTQKSLFLIPVAPAPSYDPPRAVRFDGVDETPASDPANRWRGAVPWSDADRMYTINVMKRWKCLYEFTNCIRRETYLHRVCSIVSSESIVEFASNCDVNYWNCISFGAQYFYVGDGWWCRWNKKWVVEDRTKH